MPPEKMEEVKAWIQKADQDIRAAKHDLNAEPALIEDVLFHSQQACEKILKAFLTYKDVPFSKTHDIELLGESVSKLDPTLTNEIEKVSEFTPFAWAFRYPGSGEPPSASEAQEVLEQAAKFVTLVKSRLK